MSQSPDEPTLEVTGESLGLMLDELQVHDLQVKQLSAKVGQRISGSPRFASLQEELEAQASQMDEALEQPIDGNKFCETVLNMRRIYSQMKAELIDLLGN